MIESTNIRLEPIESATNSKIKLVGKLRNAKYREKEGMFIAEGVRLLEMAIDSQWEIFFAFVAKKAQDEQRVRKLISNLAEINCPIYSLGDALYKKVAGTVHSQGVLSVVKSNIAQNNDLEDILSKENPIVVVLDSIQDPGNAGTIIRSGDSVGVDAIICLENTVDVLSEKVVRASMGSIFNLPIFTNVSCDDLLRLCKKHGVSVLATALDKTAVPYFQANYTGKMAIVLGNEGNGVSEKILALSNNRIYIPMKGKAESLNVAIAAAIIMYEAYRQRDYDNNYK